MRKSVEEGQIIEMSSADKFADGIAIRKTGEQNFRIVRAYVDKIVTVFGAGDRGSRLCAGPIGQNRFRGDWGHFRGSIDVWKIRIPL
jgi:hypothetical protein